GGAAVNETDATRNVRGKPAERVTRGQRGQTAAGEVCLGSEAKSFNTGAEISAPEIFHVDTTAEGIVPAEQLVLADLADIDSLVRIEYFRFAEKSGADIPYKWILFRKKFFSSPLRDDATPERIVPVDMELTGIGSESVRAPDVEVPLVSAIQIAHRRCRLHHLFFLAGIFRAVGVNRRCHYEDCGQC